MWPVLFSLCLLGAPDKNTCDCPASDYADAAKANKVYALTNGKKIALCGYKNEDQIVETYSEFVLAVCGQNEVIGFWNALQDCRVRPVKDTLLVEELKYLPTGIGFRYAKSVWTTEKISFSNDEAIKQLSVNRGIRKYTSPEIAEVLQQYENAPKELSDQTMTLINRVFVATISGSAKARQYFKESATHFGVLDGAYSEEYSDLKNMLALWDKK